MRGIKGTRMRGLILTVSVVVLIILAVFLVPILMKRIDIAKEKKTIAETRLCVTAAQALVDEKYAGMLPEHGKDISIAYKDVIRQAEVPGYIKSGSLKISDKGIVTELIYHAVNGKECMYQSVPGLGERTYEIK